MLGSEAMIEPVPLGSAYLAAAETPRLSIRGVTKTWTRQPKPVLEDVEFVAPPGTMLAIVGRNGAGKTTLLRLAAGLIYPDKGIVELDGLHPKRDRREYQRRLGFLSAGSLGLYARLSPRQHLEYWARIALVPRAERDDAVERTLSRFDLDSFASRRTDRLSMGQRQRVRLAMVFLHGPRLLLLDEPYVSLDDEGRAVLDAALDDHLAGHGTVLFCSPNVEVSEKRCDAVYVVENGRLVRR
jgi:heme ABC exporter ATP-binding subunit CcmA